MRNECSAGEPKVIPTDPQVNRAMRQVATKDTQSGDYAIEL